MGHRMTTTRDLFAQLRADLMTFSPETLALWVAKNADAHKILAELDKTALDIQLEKVDAESIRILLAMEENKKLPDLERAAKFEKLNAQFDIVYKEQDRLMRLRFL